MAEEEIRWTGYIRKPVWEDIQQRPQTRLHTGVAVYNLPHIFVEPSDEDEWLKVEVTVRVIREVERERRE